MEWISYKTDDSNRLVNRYSLFKTNNKYEDICAPIYYYEESSFDILQAIEELQSSFDIDNIENIRNYTCNESNHNICQDLYSPEFVDILKNIIIDPNFDQYSDYIVMIVRNLWQAANSPNDSTIFDEEFISIIFSYFLKDEINPKTICLIFDGFQILLSKYPDILPLLIKYNIVDAICSFFFDTNLDPRDCKGRLAFPFFLIYLLVLYSPPDSPYFEPFLEICLKFISLQYGNPRLLSSQCILEMCSKDNQLISIFFSIPNNIQTIIRSHEMNLYSQIEYIYALDTLLLKSGVDGIFDQYVNFKDFIFFKNLSKYVFGSMLNQLQEEIKYVLLFLSNVMDIIWQFLLYPNLYNESDEDPIIYKIIDLSQNSKYEQRNLAGNCISRFIIVSGLDEKFQIGQDGGFSSICALIEYEDVESQYLILCALKELLLLSDSFHDEAFEIGLQNILYNVEIEDEDCNHLVTDILNCLNKE